MGKYVTIIEPVKLGKVLKFHDENFAFVKDKERKKRMYLDKFSNISDAIFEEQGIVRGTLEAHTLSEDVVLKTRSKKLFMEFKKWIEEIKKE